MWHNTLGRVAFINCEPLFFGLGDTWDILPAPPSWLTGHLLRRDCIVAPIPAADYAENIDQLVLIPNIAISSRGEVGSVLLFSNSDLEDIESVALPSDSATSTKLLKYILEQKGIVPIYHEMGPDLQSMLSEYDSCLLIGDRALEAAASNPELVKLDLGNEWKVLSNTPMVFGVFAARRDTDIDLVRKAHNALLTQLEKFDSDSEVRTAVIDECMRKTNQNRERLEKYFGEVINRIDEEDMKGLREFLVTVCGVSSEPKLAW